MRLVILSIYALSIAANIPQWFTVHFYRRPDGHIRGRDTDLYNTMSATYSLIFQLLGIVFIVKGRHYHCG